MSRWRRLGMVGSGLLLATAVWGAARPAGAQDNAFAAEKNALVSRLQSMGQGYYTAAEWNEVMAGLDHLAVRARQNRDWETAVDLNLLKSMAYSDMLHDNSRALAVLNGTLKDYGPTRAANLANVYVRMAEIYSRQGNQAGVDRVRREFQASPVYQAETYAYSGGQGRDVPLRLVRPGVIGGQAIGLTAMGELRKRAQLVPGSTFPDFTASTLQGRPLALAELRGKVVLVDFWLRNWAPWQRNLAALVSSYRRYAARGFTIVGVNVERAPEGIEAFTAQQGMAWPQVVDDTGLTAQLGIYGEAANFLLDADGSIIARDVRGADLDALLRRCLGPGEGP